MCHRIVIDILLKNNPSRISFHYPAKQIRKRVVATRGVGIRSLSTQSVRNCLHYVDLKSRSAAIKVPLTEEHKRRRLDWATSHLRWRRAGMEQVSTSANLTCQHRIVRCVSGYDVERLDTPNRWSTSESHLVAEVPWSGVGFTMEANLNLYS